MRHWRQSLNIYEYLVLGLFGRRPSWTTGLRGEVAQRKLSASLALGWSRELLGWCMGE